MAEGFKSIEQAAIKEINEKLPQFIGRELQERLKLVDVLERDNIELRDQIDKIEAKLTERTNENTALRKEAENVEARAKAVVAKEAELDKRTLDIEKREQKQDLLLAQLELKLTKDMADRVVGVVQSVFQNRNIVETVSRVPTYGNNGIMGAVAGPDGRAVPIPPVSETRTQLGG